MGNPRQVEVNFSVPSTRIRYFDTGPSSATSNVHWFQATLLKLNLILGELLHQSKHNISVHLIPSVNNLGSLSSRFWCLAQHVREKKVLQASAVDEVLQYLLRNNCQYCIFSLRKQSYTSFSASAKHCELASISIYSYLPVLLKLF